MIVRLAPSWEEGIRDCSYQISCFLPLPREGEPMSHIIAAIDVHKKMLVVAVADAAQDPLECSSRRFGTTHSQLLELREWLASQGAQEVVMESTAQYWKPVWYALEPHFRMHLAQAYSHRAPRGRKGDG